MTAMDLKEARLGASSFKILVVEDHPDMAKVMTMLLGTLGHEPAVATSIAEALLAVSKDRFDALLVDHRLPDGTGHELLTQLRFGNDIPAVLVTAFDEESLRPSMKDGFSRVLTKPVDPEKLRDVLADICVPKR